MKIPEKKAKEAIQKYIVNDCCSQSEALAKAINVIVGLYRNEEYMREEMREAMITHVIIEGVEITFD